MEIHFATWLFDRHLGNALTKVGADNRLLSYFFLNQGGVSQKQLKVYIKTGKFDPRKIKK